MADDQLLANSNATWTVTSTASGTTTAGSLGQMINSASSGDSIIFDLGTSNTVSCTGLSVTKSLDIDGSNTSGDNVIITGSKSKQLFTVTSGNTVSFSGMTMTSARSTTGSTGGAITNKGTVTITDVSLSGNTFRSSSFGSVRGAGALYNTGTATLANVMFSGNTASAIMSSTIAGAVYNYGGTINLAGRVTLATSKDTFVSTGVVSWDLSNAATRNNVTLSGYQYFTKSSGTLYITVGADDMTGSYTIAENVGSSTATSFTLTGLTGTQTITVGGDVVQYGDYYYQLSNTGSNYVLTVGTPKAPSLNVTTTVDTVSAIGNISLREAITYAATTPSLKGEDDKFTVTFDDSIFTEEQATITLGSQIQIAESQFTSSYGELVIKGTSGKTLILDGNQSNRLFDIDSGNIISLENLTMQKGYVSGTGDGAAINNSGTLTIDNVTFSGNTAHAGGAILNSADITLSGCTFTGNRTTGTSGGGVGGAVANTVGATCVLSDVVFSGNTASGSGGAVYGNKNAVITVNGATFSNNRAGGYGGGIMLGGGTQTLNISDVVFSGNTAVSGGGAIHCEGTVNLTGRVTLSTASDTVLIWGTAASLNWDLSDAATRNNIAIDGYQYVQNNNNLSTFSIIVGTDDMTGSYTIAENVGSSTLTNFKLKGIGDTTASISVGGGVVSYGDYLYYLTKSGDDFILTVDTPETPSLTVTTLDDVVNPLDNVISLREAIAYAAANESLKGSDGKFTITFADSIFTDNQATITLSNQLEVAESKFTSSYGELVIQGTSDKSLAIDGNQSCRVLRINSGNIVSLQNLSMRNGLVVTKETVGSSSEIAGGAIAINGSTLSVDNCKFIGNKCYDATGEISCGGGAIFEDAGNVTITNSDFIGNSVSGYSGASYGGAIGTCAGNVVIQGSLFQENTSISSGGAITTTRNTSTGACTDITLYECVLIDNKITGSTFGGSLCVHGGTSKIINTTIYQGQSANGGALFVDLNSGSISARCFVINSTLTANTASSGNGNGIYLKESSSQLNLLNSVIVGNDAYKASGSIITNVNNLYDSTTASAIRSAGVTTTPEATFAAVDGGTAYYQEDGTCHVLVNGPADLTGYYVWASDDFKNIAYAATESGTKTVLLGDASLATNMISVITPGATLPNIGNGISEAQINPETPSLVVTTAADGINKFDNLITFREALLYAQNNPGLKADDKFTVTFGDSLFATGTDVHYLGGTIAIGADVFTESAGKLVIQGPATDSRKTIIDGEALFQILDIASGNYVTLADITLQNGKSTYGGAVQNAGFLTLDDVVFNKNTATTSGGALYNTGKVTLAGDVTLATSTDTFVSSGTVNWDLTKATADHSVTLDNYQYFTNSGSLYLTVGNNVKAGDSFTIATGVGSSLTGKNSFTLTGLAGTASISVGGAVEYGNLTYTLTQTGDTLVLAANGYSLLLDPESIALENGKSGTSAAVLSDGKGGSLAMTSLAFSASTIANFSYELTGTGATITVTGTAAGTETVTVTATGADSNSYTADLEITVTTFYALTGKSNIQPMYAESGAAFVVGGNTVTEAEEGSAVTLAGKAVDQFVVAGYTSDDVTISAGSFTMPGKDVAVTAHYRFNVQSGNTLTLEPGTYTNILGYDGNGGMGVVQANGTLNAANVTFTGNTSAANGGAVSADGQITVTSSTFSKNIAVDGNGGAVHAVNGGTIADSVLVQNVSGGTSRGGAVYVGGTTSISGCTFTGNASAGDNGGAVYSAENGTITIVDSTFDKNIAATTGGAVYAKGTTTVSGCTFTGNTSGDGNGGAIAGDGETSFSITDTLFAQNVSMGFSRGGALYGGGTTTISGCTFTGNTSASDNGGAVYSAVGGVISITDSTFNQNICATSGSAVYAKGTTTVSGCTFTGNTAGTYGGAVSCASAISSIDNVFTGNTATTKAGGAISSDGAVTVSGNTFSSNTAAGDGGAVRTTQTLDISGSTFTGNTANRGGAMYSNNGGTITNSVFDQNISTGNSGGAMYSKGAISISGCTFTGNTSGVNGGAVYTAKGGSIGDSTFSGNAAGTYGGAIYNVGTLHLTGDVVLATSSDSVAWNITGGTSSYATVNGYSYLQNNGNAELTVVVVDEQAIGSYTIAAGAESVLADNKKNFTLRGVTGEAATITVDGGNVAYGSRLYSLDKIDDTLVLSVGIPRTLTGASNIQSMYAASGVDFVVRGNTATSAKSGDAVTLSGKAVDQFVVTGYTSNDVTISGDSFTMPDQDVTVTAQYRFNVQSGNMLSLASGTYTNALAYNGNGGMGEVYGTLNAIGTAENKIVFAGNTVVQSNGGAVHVNGGTAIFTNVNFNENSAADGYGSAVQLKAGTAILANVTFSNNVATAGGAMCIYGTDAVAFLAGTVTLATNTDTLLNGGSIYWDLTRDNAMLNGYQYLQNTGTLYLRVDSNVKSGDTFTIATGVSGTCSDSFTLAGLTGEQSITVGGGAVTYNDLAYTLLQTGDDLVLTVTTPPEVFYCSTWTTGEKIDVTWHGKQYSGTVGKGVFFNSYADAKTKAASTGDPIVVLENSTITTPVGYDAQNVYLSGNNAVYNRIIILGELISGNHEYAGDYTANIEGGTFVREVIGGDASNGVVTRTGNIYFNISGGEFLGHVAGGNYYSAKNVLGSAAVAGNIYMTLSGGTYHERVYGGCASITEEFASRVTLEGNVYLTIDASTNAIRFDECVAAGNRGHGLLLGSTNVTVTGQGGNLSFADGSVLFGGCGKDYYLIQSGVRVPQTSVLDPATMEKPGVRALTFDQFTGDFNAEIRMFSDIHFANNTNLNFADAKLDLQDICNWNFDCTSTASNLTKNKFASDTIAVDTSGLTGGSWTLLSGSEAAFADLASATSVSFSGSTATWTGSAWSDGTFSLSVDDQTKLVVSKIA